MKEFATLLRTARPDMDSPINRILIIADDLSGAADCTAGCVQAGLGTLVVLDHGFECDESRQTTQVLSIDADTRRLEPEVAARINVEVFKRYQQPGQLLYKKIDSTLRGNFVAEVSSLIPHAGMALVAPAFPAAGRCTRDGRQYVNNVPLEETDIWRSEGIPGTADVPMMLRSCGIDTASLSLHEVRTGVPFLCATLEQLAGRGVQAVVCDAETDADLQNIAQASLGLSRPTFCVGSAGLANQLPAIAGLAGDPTRLPVSVTTGPILTIVGSLSAVSRNQAETLFQSRRMTRFDVPAFLLSDEESHLDRADYRNQLKAAFANGDVLLVISDAEPADMRRGQELCRSLARLVEPLAASIGGVISTGGETTRAILSSFGIASLRVVGEVETGIPLSVACGMRSIPVISKAGAFGSAATLVHCYDVLARARQHPADGASEHNGTVTSCTLNHDRKTAVYRPIIAITMGDAAGVGPEIIMKSLAAPDLYNRCKPLVVGDSNRLREAGALVGSSLEVRSISSAQEAQFEHGIVDCVDLGLIPPGHPFGQLSALCGDAAYRYIERAVQMTRNKEIDAICTAPLNKEALHAGGHIFPGHTELLAQLTGTPEVSMMLVAPNLRVIHVTTHIGLLDAIRKIEPGLVERTIARGHDTLVRAGIKNPRIGVCGINPHAGENGLFGYGEEEEKIIPAVQAQQALGRQVEGPLPADTLFYRAGRGDFDLVVAMYHDQGHGPVKVMGLEAGVNITVGLPIIRTSVDHGTAFDIAGKGIADERSLLEALRQAVDLAAGK